MLLMAVSRDICVTVHKLLLTINEPVASAILWIFLFKTVLSGIIGDCVEWSRSFWFYM